MVRIQAHATTLAKGCDYLTPCIRCIIHSIPMRQLCVSLELIEAIKADCFEHISNPIRAKCHHYASRIFTRSSAATAVPLELSVSDLFDKHSKASTANCGKHTVRYGCLKPGNQKPTHTHSDLRRWKLMEWFVWGFIHVNLARVRFSWLEGLDTNSTTGDDRARSFRPMKSHIYSTHHHTMYPHYWINSKC